MLSTHIQVVLRWLEAERDEAEALAAKTLERESWARENGWRVAAEILRLEALR